MANRKSIKAEIKYDDDLDILTIDRIGSPIESSLGDDLLILDFDKNNDVVGLEILDFSKMTRIPKGDIKNLQKGIVRIAHEKNEKTVFISLELFLDDSKERIIMPVNAEKMGIRSSNFSAVIA